MIINWQSLPHGKEKYHAYLASPEWAIKKLAVRTRSKGTCEWCKHDKATECHHQTYIRQYNELLTDLLDVCNPCHRFLSGHSKEDPREYWIEKPVPKAYQFVIAMDGDFHAECPQCLGVGNCVHMDLGGIAKRSETKSQILAIPFWCECGCFFSWQFTTRKGYTTVDMALTPEDELAANPIFQSLYPNSHEAKQCNRLTRATSQKN